MNEVRPEGPRWYQARGREKAGPFDLDELRALARRGELRPADLLLRQGETRWAPASDVEGLFPPSGETGAPSAAQTLVPPSPLASEQAVAGNEFLSTIAPPASALSETLVVAGSGLAADPTWPAVPGHEILGLLGRGGMGVVYKARQIGLNRLVALKMIRAGGGADAEELARFFGEAEAVARFRHPSIVQIHEIGRHTDCPFFSLEFVEGGSLDRRIAGTPQPARDAAVLTEVLARTMHAAHLQGIVHRDLKPANVLLAADGTPKITDFGLAKRLDGDSGQTRSGAIMGTPSYMPPEQARGAVEQVGPLADVYALGAILYELLTGRPPFRGASLSDTLLLVLETEPVPPRRLNPRCPRDLETICLKSLQKEPGKRYPSALALADDLKRYLGGEPIQARPAGRAERLWRWSKRKPALATITLLLLVTFIGGVSGIVWQLREAEANAAEARSNAADADREREEAIRYAGQAKEEQQKAEQREEAALRYVYASFMNQVPEAWRRGDLAGVKRYLEAFLPRPGQQFDPRGFEWDYYWKMTQGSRLTLLGHSSRVLTVAFSPDSKRVISGSYDTTARIWDSASGKELERIQIPQFVTAVAVAPDGKTLALEQAGYFVLLWSGQLDRNGLGGCQSFGGLAYAPDNRTLAVASRDGTLTFRDRATGHKILHQEAINSGKSAGRLWLSFDSTGRRLLLGAEHGEIRLFSSVGRWDAGQVTAHPPLPAGPSLTALALSPDGTQLAGASEGVLQFWRVGAKELEPAGEIKIPHVGITRALAYTPDGRLLCSGGDDHTAKLWDARSRKLVATLAGHAREVMALAVSPDGKLLATGSQDNSVKLWDLEQYRSGQAAGQWGVIAVALSADERTIASSGKDGSLVLWDAATGRRLRGQEPGNSLAIGLAFLPGGDQLAIARSRSLELLNVATLQPLRSVSPQDRDGRFTSLALAPDGKLLAAGTVHGLIELFSLPGLVRQERMRGHHAAVSALSFSANGKLLTSGGWDGRTVVHDVATRVQLAEARGHGGRIIAAAIQSDGRHVMAANDNHTLTFWPLDAPEQQRGLRDAWLFGAGALSPDGQGMLWAVHNGSEGWLRQLTPVKGQDQHNEREILSVVASAQFTCLGVSPGRRTVVLGSDDGTLTVWDVVQARRVARWPGHAGGVTALTYSPDGKRLAAGGGDFTVRLLEAGSQKELAILRDHQDVITAVAFSPDGQALATAAWDGTVRLWPAGTGSASTQLTRCSLTPRALVFSPDGRTLVVGGGETSRFGFLELWDLETRKCRRLISENDGLNKWMIRRAAFLPDGVTLATVSGDGWMVPGELRLWDTRAAKLRAVIDAGHGGPITSLAIARDEEGLLMATGEPYGGVKVWAVQENGAVELLHTLDQQYGVTALTMSPDGRTLAVATHGWHLRFWQPRRGVPAGIVLASAPIHTLAFAPKGEALAAGDRTGRLVEHRRVTHADLAADSSAGGLAVTSATLASETALVGALARFELAQFSPRPGVQRDQVADLRRMLRDELADRPDGSPVLQELRALALLRLSRELRTAQQMVESESVLRQGIETLRTLVRRQPRVARFHERLGHMLFDQAVGHVNAQRSDQARQAFSDSFGTQRKALALDPESSEARRGFTRSGVELAYRLMNRGDHAAAEPILVDALDVSEQLYQDRWDADVDLRAQAEALHWLTRIRGVEPVRKLELLRRRVHVLELLLARHPQSAKEKHDLAEALARLAAAAETAGPAREAASLLARCLSITQADTKLPEAKRKTLSQEYAERAMAVLQQGGAMDRRWLESARELEPLRQREDFKQLIQKSRKGAP